MIDFHPIKTGLFLGLIVILFGFSLGITFGMYEDDIKANYSEKANAVLNTAYKGDVAAMEKNVSKAWEFLKQAHTHALGLGPIAVILILALGFINACDRVKIFTSIGIGIGALGYPLYWTLASVKAPAYGDYHAVKESLAWVAQPSAGLLFLGLLVIVFLFAKNHLFVCSRK